MAIGGFMLAWSNYYQDLRPVMVPTFEKYLDPVPKIEGQFIYDTLAQVPHLGIHYSIKKIDEMFNEMHSKTSRVDIRLTSAEIMAIRNKGIKNIKMRVSTMDCVVAYLVAVLNRTEDVPIHEVSSYIGVRHA
jgi:cbb3-type cytochrome oxidase cytochrome c subunit